MYEIAQNLDMSPQAFSYLINKGQKPGFETIDKIATYFQVTTDYLLGKSNIKIPEAAALECVGLEALKEHLNRYSTIDTDLINSLNMLLGDTLINLKYINGDIDTLVLKNVAAVLQMWNDFIETVDTVNYNQNKDILPGKEAAKNRLYETTDSIRNLFMDSGNALIDQLYSNNNNT